MSGADRVPPIDESDIEPSKRAIANMIPVLTIVARLPTGGRADPSSHRTGRAAACRIHEAAWRSSRSSTDARSTPRESLPIPIRVTGGTGLSEVPRPKVSLTWPAKPPQQKHQPSPTPYQAMPHFTERCSFGRVLAARASTRSAMPRCGWGRLWM